MEIVVLNELHDGVLAPGLLQILLDHHVSNMEGVLVHGDLEE